MELVELKIELPQSAYHLQKALMKIAYTCHRLKENGWVVGEDRPELTAAIADLYAELSGVPEVKILLKSDKMAAIAGLAAGAIDAN